MNAEFPLHSAEAVEEVAATWLARLDRNGLLHGECDLDELSVEDPVFSAWVHESTLHRVAFLRLLAAWKRSERLAARRRGDLSAPRSFIRRPVIQALAAAACMAIAVIGAGTMGMFGTAREAPVPSHYETYLGEIRTVQLADGSAVTLNTDTRISVAYTPEARRVTLLKGEAYFEVTPAPDRPFQIDAGEGRVEVLGTAFGIELLNAGTEVAVSEGTVWFGKAADIENAASVLEAGMIGYASPDGVIVERSGGRTVQDRLLWREGRLRFDDTPLRDVAAEFNRYNTTKLVIADNATGAVEIAGTFPLDNVEAFARLAEEGLGLQGYRSTGRIELSGS